ncbi:Rne/Rng family ribonuclease [Micromonospora sp. HM5-17]|uniref:Rne/Rng family ribonuclease n=1 Tax=Micromonospora sp. HM5-17 TaxID=2487710 RepID=UPI000F4A52DF|nr:Rne/Rng family ribonuclease [Micromonospora sp. HM5-17]ROT27062.1 Rne/Rng family ribonuclease [Micromonospora sp. HM5-17]
MLENEPEGGERTGAEPGNVTANEISSEAPARRTRTTRRRTSAPPSEPAPTGVPVEAPTSVRATSGEAADAEVLAPVTGDTESTAKAPRRRRKATTADKGAASASAEAAATGASGAAAGGPGDAADATAAGGDTDAAGGGVPDGATGASSAPDGGTGPSAAGSAAEAEQAGPAAPAGGAAETAAGEAAAPVKVTRTRRKKAAAPAAPPAASSVGTASGEHGAPAGQPETGSEPPVAGGGAPGVTGAAGTGGDAASPTGASPTGAAPTGSGTEPAVVRETGTGAAGTGEEEPRRRRAVLSAPTVLFMAPEPEAPTSRAAEPAAGRPEGDEAEPGEPAETVRRRRRGRRTTEPAEPEIEAEAEPEPVVAGEEPAEVAERDEDEETVTSRRRRRRGRRGRGRGKGTPDDVEEVEEAPSGQTEVPAVPGEGEDEEAEVAVDGVTRRRRRRRRKGSGETESVAEDGVPTVIKIREPRKTVDEVQGVSGSTRLEAKRQRRRDGREQRRTRPPILTESEFLARREAVDRVMVIRQRGDRTQIAVLEDGVLVEHYVSRASSGTMAGNVYLGKVQNVLPSMEAAFVDVGRGRNAVLYAGEVNWDITGLEGRARSIEQALRSGDSVLVQVTKDPIGHKGARLTSHIALSGRHLVYVPHGNASGISRKLPDTERKRLRDILKKLVPDGAGVIVRTAAEGATEDELARDVKRLQAQWEDIQAKAAAGGAPMLLYEEPDLVIRVVRDLFNEDFRELIVQGDEAYDMVESYLSHVSPDLVPRLRRHTGTVDVFAERRIDEQILKGLDRKVFLPSGGHLVIDRTEAMTVIDVNTGKYTGAGGNLEETVTRNNLEAAEEIVRQLRLRDLGGIIVIDFIDMVLESNRELVLRRLTECLGRDRTKHQVTEITSLGLVQMTRKRIGAGLLEAFSETCECCKGRGVIIHTEPVPEKPRSGAGDRVKAVASAATNAPATSAPATNASATSAPAGNAPATSAPTASAEPAAAPVAPTRRRGRKAASERVVVEASDYQDTMGYDLSRYEAESPSTPDAAETPAAEPMRLAGPGDPDALPENGDLDADADVVEPGARRRIRRGSVRRRTRP